MSDFSNVSVRSRTKERLKEVGKYGDSADSIINRALDALETQLRDK